MNAPEIIFLYRHSVNASDIAGTDLAILDPDSNFRPDRHRDSRPRILAYTSVGEALPTRSWFADIPQECFAGHHEAWQSHVVDPSIPAWTDFYIEHIARPCWQAGYKGFFLDTMDSWQLLEPDSIKARACRRGIVHLVQRLRAAFPDASIITNRGFEVLHEIHRLVDAIAFESLYLGWDQQGHRYVDVPEADRNWLLAQAAEARTLGVPVIAIDYCPEDAPAQAQATAARIRQHGLVPCVTDSYFQTAAAAREEAHPRG